jgi:hypothetical protein
MRREKPLYQFCQETSCTDGAGPIAPLLPDAKGNLYGTTNAGGDKNAGTVYALVHSRKGFLHRTRYSFCQRAGCADGDAPDAPGLVMDSNGNLLGTTVFGGTTTASLKYGGGVVFRVTPTGSERVLHAFCTDATCSDGYLPGQLTLDAHGNLIGTTESGGTFGGGTVFQLTGKTYLGLYSFCTDLTCAFEPEESGVVADAKGNLFGTSFGGGARDYGTVYELKYQRF